MPFYDVKCLCSGEREGGKPLPLAYQYLIFMVLKTLGFEFGNDIFTGNKMPTLYPYGGILQLRGHNSAIFCPPPLRGQFLYLERGQKQTFFDPLPPNLVHLVIE